MLLCQEFVKEAIMEEMTLFRKCAIVMGVVPEAAYWIMFIALRWLFSFNDNESYIISVIVAPLISAASLLIVLRGHRESNNTHFAFGISALLLLTNTSHVTHLIPGEFVQLIFAIVSAMLFAKWAFYNISNIMEEIKSFVICVLLMFSLHVIFASLAMYLIVPSHLD
jgi:hypothetical protein